jgi:hypothetical protein
VGATVESNFVSKPLGGSSRKRHCHKPWFDVDCHIPKCELRLSLKANPDLHVVKHQKSKLKTLLKKIKNSRKLQKLNICVRLPRWIHSRFRKSIGQGHPLQTRSMQLQF